MKFSKKCARTHSLCSDGSDGYDGYDTQWSYAAFDCDKKLIPLKNKSGAFRKDAKLNFIEFVFVNFKVRAFISF